MKTLSQIQVTTNKGTSYTEIDRLIEEGMLILHLVESHHAQDDSWAEDDLLIILQDLPEIESELGSGPDSYGAMLRPDHDCYDVEEGEKVAEMIATDFIIENY